MWKYHRCYGYIINPAFPRKICFSEMVWYFIGVYIINRTLHGRLEIRNFSSRVENISLVRCAHSWNIFQHSKRNFVSPRSHVISSITLKVTSPKVKDNFRRGKELNWYWVLVFPFNIIMYSQVFLLLTHSHVQSLQFSPKLFPMELSLVKARLAKENKMGKKTKQKQQGRESWWLKSKGSDHFKLKATRTYVYPHLSGCVHCVSFASALFA